MLWWMNCAGSIPYPSVSLPTITLLATAASNNGWDRDRVAKEWNIHRAQVLRTDYNESLAAIIELSLASPAFRKLGLTSSELSPFSHHLRQKEHLRQILCSFISNGFIATLAPLRDHFSQPDPKSPPLLRATRDRHSTRLSASLDPTKPGFREARWIMSEDVNAEHLLDVLVSIDTNSDEVWNTCIRFMQYLYWHKPRETVLGPRSNVFPTSIASSQAAYSRSQGCLHWWEITRNENGS